MGYREQVCLPGSMDVNVGFLYTKNSYIIGTEAAVLCIGAHDSANAALRKNGTLDIYFGIISDDTFFSKQTLKGCLLFGPVQY